MRNTLKFTIYITISYYCYCSTYKKKKNKNTKIQTSITYVGIAKIFAFTLVPGQVKLPIFVFFRVKPIFT